jgi:CSLREA domain-containing protein
MYWLFFKPNKHRKNIMKKSKYLLMISLAFMPFMTNVKAVTLTVNSNGDTNDGACDSHCTLREAVAKSVSGDTINFSSALNNATIIPSSQITIDKAIIIDGTNTKIMLSGNNQHRIFSIPASGGNTVLKKLKFIHGKGDGLFGGGAIENGSQLGGNGGKLTIDTCIFDSNLTGQGGAIYNRGGELNVIKSWFISNTGNAGGGGAIASVSGKLFVYESLFEKNDASNGGAILNAGLANIANNTFTRNTAGNGGAIYNTVLIGTGNMANNNNTFINNTATVNGSEINNGSGAGINLFNSILYRDDNTIPLKSLCFNSGTLVGTRNLINDSSCNTGGNLLGNPLLGSLADNGGVTKTFLPQSDSPVIDAGTDTGCPTIDQRGITRPQGARCDIGAVEVVAVAVDTTPPTITVPANQISEATRPDGAIVNFTVTATDAVDGSIPANQIFCTPKSTGDIFPVDVTTVACTAIDKAGNESAPKSFTVTIVDTTSPTLTTLPENQTLEATSAAGAVASFVATATDIVDGEIPATCLPSSGGTFPLGTTKVTCKVQDKAGNPNPALEGAFNITVQDTTKPSLTVADQTAEATSASGAVVNFTATATDLVDGAITPVCNHTSGSTFPIGVTTVSCTATDAAKNADTKTFKVTVTNTGKPTLNLPSNLTAEASSASGAVVNYSASATDIIDGNVPTTCTPASGSTFTLGTTTVNCKATNSIGNESTGSFNVAVVDTTKPNLLLPSTISTNATDANGAVVSYNATATDSVQGNVPVSCSPVSGSVFTVGTTTVNCSATDGTNVANGSFNVDVLAITSKSLVVIKNGTGSGRVFSVNNKGIIDCGNICSNDSTANLNLILMAIPDNNSVFFGWSGACQKTAPACTVKFNKSLTVQATFTLKSN